MKRPNFFISFVFVSVRRPITRFAVVHDPINFTVIHRDAIATYSGPAYFLAQPNVRTRPRWFLPLMPSILRSLSGVLSAHNPDLFTIKSFSSGVSELDSDGVHFSALSGRDYVLHLIDQSR